jgi:DinB superfamily
MMPHPLVSQLRFTRREFMRAVKGVSDHDARQRLLPMNCISWNIGHLAWQEQRYFLYYGQGEMLFPDINEAFAYGAPASTPALKEVLSAWSTITKAADPWLDGLTSEKLEGHVINQGKPTARIFGNLLQRVIYHYWYHIGENMAIRQQLGHQNLATFVGNIDHQAPYRREMPGIAELTIREDAI